MRWRPMTIGEASKAANTGAQGWLPLPATAVPVRPVGAGGAE